MSSEKKREMKKNKKQKKGSSKSDCDHEDRIEKKARKHAKHSESDITVDIQSLEEAAVQSEQVLDSEKDLKARIKEDNDFFMKVINLIPPQFYFDDATNEDVLEMRTSGMVRKKGQKSKRTQDSENHHASVKRARFDPDSNQTVQRMEAQCQHQNNKKAETTSRHPAELGKSNVEELRERLHQRLEELKQQRTTMGKGVYKDERQRLKRRESKLKRKIKLRTEKTYKTAPIPKVNGDFPTEPSKPIFNKEGKLVYSKFDFTDLGDKKEKSRSDFTGKNYQKLLAKVEKRNEKLKNLKATNPEKGEDLEEKIKWESALHRAEGIKVKDNPDMLKRALKSKEKKKQVKGKKWDTRVERTDKMKDDKQQKRHVNIKAQKQKNLDKKVKKLKKKGRLIPGF